MHTEDQCEQCHSGLDWRGTVLTCVRCGVQFPNHPKSILAAAIAKRQQVQRPIVDQCKICSADLSWVDSTLTCFRCGRSFPDHPKSIAAAAFAAAQQGQKSTLTFTPSAKVEIPADPRVISIERAIDGLATKRK